jgi:molybdopterin-guanine dinucleotide biosynthesis protein A
VNIVGLLLAGGQSRRMGGGDKTLRLLRGKTILERVIERLRPQVAALVINANGDPARLAEFGLPIVPDSVPGYAGPLAGVLAGLDWAAANRAECEAVVSVATDAPFFPGDLARRLAAGAREADAPLACAASRGRAHPVFGLWPIRLRQDLRRALVEEGIRKVDLFTARYPLATVSFTAEPIDPFFNLNRPEDVDAAEALLTALEG